MQLIIDLPARDEQIAFNRRRWAELLSDPALAELPYPIETNAHGQIIMNPPPAGEHSYLQGEIAYHLRRLLGGRALPACPVSTIDGVKAVDVGWYSDTRLAEVRGQDAFEKAPEICVEVLSPSNTAAEMAHTKDLHFEAGACEVWLCQAGGVMAFYHSQHPQESASQSTLCFDFPKNV